MANIYDIAAAQQQPNVMGNIQAGINFGQKQQVYGEQQQAYQQQLAQQQQMQGLAPQVIAGDPNAFAQAAAINPAQAQQYQSAGDNQLKRLSGAITYMDQVQKTGNPQAIEQAYQTQVVPYLKSFGQDPPPTFQQAQPLMEQARAKIASFNASQPNDLATVSAGGAVYDKTHQKLLYQNPGVSKPATMVTIHTPNGDQQAMLNPDGTLSPLKINSQMGAPASGAAQLASSIPAGLPAETQAYVPKVMAALNGAPAFDAQGNPTPQMLAAVKQVESNGNPNAVSPAGAQGAYQLMPATAASVGVSNSFDPQQAQAGASQYLSQLYKQFGGNEQLAIAAYNAGPGRVQQAMGQQAPSDQVMTSLGPSQLQSPQPVGAPPPVQPGDLPTVTVKPDPSQMAAQPPNAAGSLPVAPQGQPGMQAPQGSPQAAPSPLVLPGGLGMSHPKGTSSVIDQRVQQVEDLAKNGIMMTPEQRQQYLTTGKMDQSFQGAGSVALPGDTTKVGAPYISTLPPGVAEITQGLLDGTKPWPTGTVLKNPLWAQAVVAAQHADPSFNAATYQQRAKATSYFTNGKGGDMIRQLQSISMHSNQYAQDVQQLNNGNVTPFNSLKNTVGSAFGATAPGNVNTDADAVSEEVSKFLTGGVPAISTIKGWKDNLGTNASKQQQLSNLSRVLGIVGGQLTSLTQQYRNAMGPVGQPLSVVSPDAAEAFQNLVKTAQAAGIKLPPHVMSLQNELGVTPPNTNMQNQDGNSLPNPNGPQQAAPAAPDINALLQKYGAH